MATITLKPVQELAPGQVSAIRNSVIDAVVEMASAELGLPKEQLVVRDIRAYDDLKFGANTDYMATATSTNVWGTFKHSDAYVTDGSGGDFRDAIPDDTTMADSTFVAIYGVRDMRLSLNSVVAQDISLIKFNVGSSDKVIWDLTKCEAYRDGIAGVSPSAIIIPPLTPYQISPYLIAGSTAPYLQLMGVVVEPVGVNITPGDNTETGKPFATHLIPVAELAPGAVSAIRNFVIEYLVARASRELNLSPDDLVVRDIRPYSDLKWCTSTDAVTAALTEDKWDATSDDSKVYGKFVGCVADGSNVMADRRYVGIYGVKDLRMALATKVPQALSMIKLNVGGNDRVIWDLQNMQAYPSALSAVCTRAVVIPPNTTYQIYLYGGLSDDGASTDINQYIMLEGVVVEPVGKVLSP